MSERGFGVDFGIIGCVSCLNFYAYILSERGFGGGGCVSCLNFYAYILSEPGFGWILGLLDVFHV